MPLFGEVWTGTEVLITVIGVPTVIYLVGALKFGWWPFNGSSGSSTPPGKPPQPPEDGDGLTEDDKANIRRHINNRRRGISDGTE